MEETFPRAPEKEHFLAARGRVHQGCPRLVEKLIGHIMECLPCRLSAPCQRELV
jgi:hypothetical protein